MAEKVRNYGNVVMLPLISSPPVSGPIKRSDSQVQRYYAGEGDTLRVSIMA